MERLKHVIPTIEQCIELRERCKYEWVEIEGINGVKFTGPSGNSIFIPASGVGDEKYLQGTNLYAYIWTCNNKSSYPSEAYFLECSKSSNYIGYASRHFGLSIRPVMYDTKMLSESFIDNEEDIADVDIELNRLSYVDLDLPSGTLWATCNLGAKSPEDEGYYFSWGETSPKSEFYNYDYKLYDNPNMTLLKYNKQDELIQLEDIDDAAYNITNGQCVMPTYKQMRELIDNTVLEWTENYNGAKGFKFHSLKSDNYMFIPCSFHYKNGIKYNAYSYKESFACWLKDRSSAPVWAYAMKGIYKEKTSLCREELYVTGDSDTYLRVDGLPIRPVLK